MSDDIKGGGDQSAEDPIKQLKSEVSRKLSNSEAKVAELMASQQILLAKLDEMSGKLQAPKESASSPADDFYSDPSGYVNRVASQAVNEAISKQTMAQSTLSSLYDQFPELTDAESELSRKAVELFSKLPKSEQQSPSALRLATLEAASELDIKPRKKRPVEDDEPIGNGRSAQRRRVDRLDPVTEQWANILKLDVNDPKVRQELIEKQKKYSRS